MIRRLSITPSTLLRDADGVSSVALTAITFEADGGFTE
jgi:hypothetical protein